MSSNQRETETGVQRRLVHAYYETTSSADRSAGEDYRARTAGLARGLGDWLDVEGRRVIDLGSGTGELCWLAVDRGAQSVTGVTLSTGEIEHSAAHVEAEFVCADVLEFLQQAESGSADRIYALNLLEHLPDEVLVALLEEAVRVLAPGGMLTAMVPNATSPYGGMTRYWDFTHYRAFTPSSVRQLMRLTGFSYADFREWGPRAHGMKSSVRVMLWKILRLIISFRLLVETASTKGGVYTADMLFRLSKGEPKET